MMEFLSLENSSLTDDDLLLTEIKQEIDDEVDALHVEFVISVHYCSHLICVDLCRLLSPPYALILLDIGSMVRLQRMLPPKMPFFVRQKGIFCQKFHQKSWILPILPLDYIRGSLLQQFHQIVMFYSSQFVAKSVQSL